MVQLEIKARQTASYFLCIVVLLTLLHCLALFLFFHSDKLIVQDFTLWFDLDTERNIPSLYSAAAILFCGLLSLLLAYFAKRKDTFHAIHWLGLACIFLFLSLDEACELHEALGDWIENYVHATGLIYFPWVLPYSVFTCCCALLYWKFFLQLPRKTKRLFIIFGAMYLIGAVFFDMLGGREAELHGFDSMLYCLLYTVEEVLEMLGIVGIIYTLLDYLEEQYGTIVITLQRKSLQ